MCLTDYIEVYKLGNTSTLLGRYCNETTPGPIVVAASRVRVIFHSDDTPRKPHNSGFRAMFEFLGPQDPKPRKFTLFPSIVEHVYVGLCLLCRFARGRGDDKRRGSAVRAQPPQQILHQLLSRVAPPSFRSRSQNPPHLRELPPRRQPQCVLALQCARDVIECSALRHRVLVAGLSCANAVVKIFEGRSERPNHEFCGNIAEPLQLISNSSSLRVQ